jgi:hypothetical protein
MSHPAALEKSTRYIRETVDQFFSKYTRMEIAFAGRPRGFKVPNYKIYTYEHSEGLALVCEVETRLVKRNITPHCDFDVPEVERTDYLPLDAHNGM